MTRAALVPALAVLAVLSIAGSPVATARPQQAAGDVTSLVITSASTPDYPADPHAVTVCVDGQALVMEAGDQDSISDVSGELTADVYDNDDGQCSGTPDVTLDFTVEEGTVTGLVVGFDSLFTYVLDESCMESGTGRIQLANGADFPQAADYYAMSEFSDDAVLLASDVLPGTSVVVPDVPAGPYAIRAYTPGTPDPETTAPLATFGAFDLQAGYQTQVFLAGSDTGDNQLGTFEFSQGPLICDAPPEEAPSTTAATTTTTAPVRATDAAVAATPVSAAATYTG